MFFHDRVELKKLGELPVKQVVCTKVLCFLGKEELLEREEIAALGNRKISTGNSH